MAQAPSPPSLDELLSHMGWVRNLARGLVREEDAEDLAQETMLRAIQTPPKHSENLRGWLAMISRNLMRSTNRRDSRRAQRFEERPPQPMEPPKPEELFYRAEMAENVRKLVDRLDDNTRYLILLRFHEERKVDDIAQMLGISRRAAQSRLDRAMGKLRESMRVHFGKDYLVACLILAAPVGPPIATAVPAGTGAAVGGISGSGMAVLLQSLLAIAALLLPVYFVAFDDSEQGGLAEPISTTANANAILDDSQEPGKQERTEAVVATTAPDTSTIQLTVQDAIGMPIPHASVAVRKGGAARPTQIWPSALDSTKSLVFSGQADETGQLEMRLPADSKLNIFVGEQYHQVERLPITTPKLGVSKDLTVNLGAAASIHGLAVDGLGQGVANAVVLLQRGHSTNKFQTRSFVHRALTAEDGSYELPSVPAGEYLLQVGHQGYERLISTPFSVTEDDCGKQISRRLELSRGLSISGKFDDANGDPIAGATLWVMDPSELPRGSADPVPPMDIPHSGESAEDGSFLVHGWSQARGSALMIVAPGYLTTVVPNSEIQDPLRITLQRGLSLSVKVQQNQKLIPAAKVKLTHRLTSTRTRGKTETTQANGRASFHGLAPGLYHATVSDERGFGATLPFELSASGQMEVLELGHGAGFELTATDEHGKPLQNLPLHMMRLNDLPNTTVAASAGVTDQSSVTGKTNVYGRFSMHVRPGVWMVTARPKDRAPLSQKIELHANDLTKIEHQFGLVGSLAVTALGPDGRPLRNLQVALAPESGHQSTNRVDVAGSCFFRDLKPGTYLVYPWNPRQQPSQTPAGAIPVMIRPGEQTEIELDSAFVAVPTFRVLRNGRLVEGAEIRLTPLFAAPAPTFDSRHTSAQHTDGSGQWTASPIRTGSYLVAVRGGANQPEQRWNLDLKSGISKQDLNLEEFQVSGRLALADGEAISGIRVELERQVLANDGTVIDAPIGTDEALVVQAVSGENGIFRFNRIPAGSWQLRIRGQKWAGPNMSLFQVKDGDADLGDLQVEESCAVRLKLSAQAIKESESGEGSAPGLELVHLASGLRYQLYANNQGLAERSDLPSGEYELLLADRPATPLTLTAGNATERILN
jgi:RNA polymerase sigma factor (sigma-70 family)